jgi:hypothetical protein
MTMSRTLNSSIRPMNAGPRWRRAAGVLGAAALWLAMASAAAFASAESFATPEQAMDAFLRAAEAEDAARLKAIFGPGAEDVLNSGDEARDRGGRRLFVAKARESLRLEAQDDSSVVAVVGVEAWPFPIPIVRDGELWRFDLAEGRVEVLARRIGRNELSAIELCRLYVRAQRAYASADRNGDGVLQFARRFASTPGERDGLYWKSGPGEAESPFGPLVATARAEGYRTEPATSQPRPFRGYLFRILTRQGGKAAGGAHDYVINGRMIAGFAMIASPVSYGNSGIKTFVVNHNGTIFEKDLGPDTAKLAAGITAFDPDASWRPVD